METVHGFIDLHVLSPMHVYPPRSIATFRFPNSDVWSLIGGCYHVGPNLKKIRNLTYGHSYTSGAHVESLMRSVEIPRTHLIWLAKDAIKFHKRQLDTFLKKHPRITRRVQGEIKKLETFLEPLLLKEFLSKGIRQKIAARSIQRAFRNAIENPGYRMCKNRLLREFQELAE